MVAVFDERRWSLVYPCLATQEHLVLAGIDFIRPPGDFNVLKAPIDVLASLSGLTSPSERYDCFKSVYGLTERTLTIDGVDIVVYELNTSNFFTLRAYLATNPAIPPEDCICFRPPWGS